MRSILAGFIKRSSYHRYALGSLVLFVALNIVIFIFPFFYYRIMPGSWFLNYYTVDVYNANVGEDVLATLCRTNRAGTLFNVDAIRTIYLVTDDQNNIPKNEFYFSPIIQDGPDECLNITITTERQPQEPGNYLIETIYRFQVHGVTKQITVRSNIYQYGSVN